jgi:hypothetical protein
MNGQRIIRMKTIFNLLLIFGLAVFTAQAQDQVPPPMPAGPTFTDAQLQQLLGPIALYPDPLIAIMLPAATLPTEIVMADRYVSAGGDPNQIDQQPWDPNVQALAHYPDVLKWMDDNLNWTTQLGEAFANQQQDVMTAMQELRTQAYNLGNLQSNPQQQVTDDDGSIEILPADPNDIYVPQYQPDQVYYDQPYGTPFITFGVGFVIGPWLCGDFDWHNRHLIFWDRDHPRPDGWWRQSPGVRANYVAAGRATVWSRGNRANYAPAFQGDRGYGSAPDVRNSYDNHLQWTAPAVDRPAPAPEIRQDNAFIGIQSAHDTRDYSNRGERSMETMPQFHDMGGFHAGSPPPSGGGFHPSAPPAGGGGGGGGGRR